MEAQRKIYSRFDKNHFSSRYGTPGLPDSALNTNMIAAHKMAKKNIERLGINIYNATLGGNLEVYPRVEFRKTVQEK